MYRKIMGFLEAWKESEHRKPLILQGARQVGKTYSILEFGRTHYENVAYFNFETNPKLNETFEENISPDYLIPILSHIAGQTIVKEKTLIVFDEVQLYERALTSLKYFCEDAPVYPSLVSRPCFSRRDHSPKSIYREFSPFNPRTPGGSAQFQPVAFVPFFSTLSLEACRAFWRSGSYQRRQKLQPQGSYGKAAFPLC